MSVAGCPNMNPKDGMTLSRRGNETVVECDSNAQTSTFRCNGTTWIGQLPNCTEQESSSELENRQHIAGRTLCFEWHFKKYLFNLNCFQLFCTFAQYNMEMFSPTVIRHEGCRRSNI